MRRVEHRSQIGRDIGFVHNHRRRRGQLPARDGHVRRTPPAPARLQDACRDVRPTVKLHRFDGNANGEIERTRSSTPSTTTSSRAWNHRPGTEPRDEVIEVINLYLFPGDGGSGALRRSQGTPRSQPKRT